MNDERRPPRIGSATWYDRAQSRLHGAWGRDHALEWIERCASVGWWTLVLPAREWSWSDGMYRLHGGARKSVGLEPGAGAIVSRMMPADRRRVGGVLSVFDEARNLRPEELRVEYWVPSEGAIPRRVRLHGQLEPVSGTGRISWAGCAEDVTDAYFAERALSALGAAEDALVRWRSFDPSLEHLLRQLAAALESPVAMAWNRGGDGRLEARVQWGVSAATHDAAAESALGSTTAARHRSLARTVWATSEAVAADGGLAVPATWHGRTVAALTFDASDAPYLDERLAGCLRWVGSALGRRLTGDRPEVGETRLSDREREVLQLAANGYDGPAIAQHLLLSPATVKTHFLHVYEKLGVNERPAAVARALREGLIS